MLGFEQTQGVAQNSQGLSRLIPCIVEGDELRAEFSAKTATHFQYSESGPMQNLIHWLYLTHRHGVTSPTVAFDRYIVGTGDDSPYFGPVIPNIYSGFSLSTHIADPSCARLMWPGPTVVCSILHNPPHDARVRPPAPPRSAGACSPGGHAGARGRTEGPATSTLLLLLIQLVEYLLVPRVELSILLIAAAGPLGQRGCAESRHPRLRLIISEIGGCIVDLPPDTEEIERSLRLHDQIVRLGHLRRDGLRLVSTGRNTLELTNPGSDAKTFKRDTLARLVRASSIWSRTGSERMSISANPASATLSLFQSMM